MTDGQQPIHIVTDSGAHFPTALAPLHLPITILPNRLTIQGRVFREGFDLDTEEAIRLISHQPTAPHVEPPSPAEYQETYERLARAGSAIISLHPSRTISKSWENANHAAETLLGHTRLEVIDSGSVSTALALLVLMAGRMVEKNDDFDHIVRTVRSAIDRLYVVFYVETMDYLVQNGFMSPSHGILGTMLGTKTFVTMENGELHLMEKVRTRIQAVERLAEFASEFTELDDAVLVQHKPYPNDTARMLQDRLAVDFPNQPFPSSLYGASLAALIGADATGLVILESESGRE